MKLLFITDNFPPEVNAPATRTFEHCLEWVKNGVDVTVITCAPNFPQGKVYDGYKNRLYSRETIDGIKVIRVWSYITSNEGFLKRTLDYYSFAVSAFFAGLGVRSDLIVATSPQFFAALSGRWLSFFKRRPWVMEVRDLWPESIKTVGAMKDGMMIRLLEKLELRLYRSAKRVITVTHSFKRNLIQRGISADKIDVITNGANLDLFRPVAKDAALLAQLNLEGKFIAGYIGTHGMAHKLEFLLDCARDSRLENVHFLFVGSGARKAYLVEQAEKMELDNVTFIDPVPKEEVPQYISILDTMIIPLKKSPLFKTVIPSKIFETAAMKKPILLGVDGEAREIVESYEAGLFFEPENKTEFVEKLLLLRRDDELYANIAEGGAKLALELNRKSLAVKMLKALRLAE